MNFNYWANNYGVWQLKKKFKPFLLLRLLENILKFKTQNIEIKKKATLGNLKYKVQDYF